MWIKTLWFKFICICACKVRGSGSVWCPMRYGSGRLGFCTFSPCWLCISGPLCGSEVSGQARGRLWTICCPQCSLHRLARCCHQRGRKFNNSPDLTEVRTLNQCSGSVGAVCFWTSRIRSCNLFVPIQIRILPSTNKKMKNPWFLLFCHFVTSLWCFTFEEWCKKE